MSFDKDGPAPSVLSNRSPPLLPWSRRWRRLRRNFRVPLPDMLSPEVRPNWKNASTDSGPITRDMLPADVLADLNGGTCGPRLPVKCYLGCAFGSESYRTPQMIQPSSITTSQLNEQILKYLKPEITLCPVNGLIFTGQRNPLLPKESFLPTNGNATASRLRKQWQVINSEVNGILHDGTHRGGE